MEDTEIMNCEEQIAENTELAEATSAEGELVAAGISPLQMGVVSFVLGAVAAAGMALVTEVIVPGVKKGVQKIKDAKAKKTCEKKHKIGFKANEEDFEEVDD